MTEILARFRKFGSSFLDAVDDNLLLGKKNLGIHGLNILERIIDSQLLILNLTHIVIRKSVQSS